MVLLLSVHPSREKDLLTPQRIELTPGVAARQGLDPFGNVWTRLLAPAGRLEIRTDFLIHDSGLPDEVAPPPTPAPMPAPFPAPSARSSTPSRSRSTFLSELNQPSELLATRLRMQHLRLPGA